MQHLPLAQSHCQEQCENGSFFCIKEATLQGCPSLPQAFSHSSLFQGPEPPRSSLILRSFQNPSFPSLATHTPTKTHLSWSPIAHGPSSNQLYQWFHMFLFASYICLFLEVLSRSKRIVLMVVYGTRRKEGHLPPFKHQLEDIISTGSYLSSGDPFYRTVVRLALLWK